MRWNFSRFVLSVVAATAVVLVEDSQAATTASLLTAREQASRMSGHLNRSRGLAFEESVQSQREAAGYRVLQTKSPNNMGVDRIATRNGQVQFIQAKAWKSVRGGTVGGALDALEFYGGDPGKRLPFLHSNSRCFVIIIPKDNYAKGIEKGLLAACRTSDS